MSNVKPDKAWNTTARKKGQNTHVERQPRCECGAMFPHARHPETGEKVCVQCLPR